MTHQNHKVAFMTILRFKVFILYYIWNHTEIINSKKQKNSIWKEPEKSFCLNSPPILESPSLVPWQRKKKITLKMAHFYKEDYTNVPKFKEGWK